MTYIVILTGVEILVPEEDNESGDSLLALGSSVRVRGLRRLSMEGGSLRSRDSPLCKSELRGPEAPLPLTLLPTAGTRLGLMGGALL